MSRSVREARPLPHGGAGEELQEATYQEALEAGERRLAEAGVPDSSLDAWYLLEHCCRLSRARFLIRRTEIMPEPQRRAYERLLEKRSLRIPLQQITGTQEFMGLTFRVNEHVLVPRQDTELLVEEVLNAVKPGMHILDMCTGSGCILISLLSLGRELTGVGVDISADALAVAKANAKALLPEKQVEFVQSDLFARVSGHFDVLVSNPPYIPAGEIPSLMPEVRLHEPVNALDGGEDGLDFYRILARESESCLVPGGLLAVEIGWDQGEAVSALFAQAGYRGIRVIKDLAGHDRVVLGRRENDGGR